jgi:SAM-dependent methyltransferase
LTRLYTEHAELYDRAFAWDVDDEVEWLLARLGRGSTKLLEPGCGSGRYFEAFSRRGAEVVGIDNSKQMVAKAAVRGTAVLADMVEFDLHATFDGAFCAINTLAILTPDEIVAHLHCVGRHLQLGARYLVQLDLRDPRSPESGLRSSTWRVGDLSVTWAVEDIDLENAREYQRSRIEILSGREAGELLEEIHVVTAWTPQAWARALGSTSFERTAVYDGDQPARPRIEPGQTGRLLWHELTWRGS